MCGPRVTRQGEAPLDQGTFQAFPRFTLAIEYHPWVMLKRLTVDLRRPKQSHKEIIAGKATERCRANL